MTIGTATPVSTALRVIGGLLTVAGTCLPGATFVLNDGPYPGKATLEFFTEPFGVEGYRLHLLVFGVAAVVLALVPVPGQGRILRALGAGVVAVSAVNGLWIAVDGGGLGAVTVSEGDVSFGALVALAGGSSDRSGGRT
jgi:branched-chain amino acid transport system permease protein